MMCHNQNLYDLERTHRALEAIAAGFALPVASVREIVWPIFWRRSVVRCGGNLLLGLTRIDGTPTGSSGVAGMFHADREETEGRHIPSRHSRPSFPWMSPREHLHAMMRAASVAQFHTSAKSPCRGTCWFALSACERELDAEIEFWIGGMDQEWAASIRQCLSTWDAAPDPVAVLDGLESNYLGPLLGRSSSTASVLMLRAEEDEIEIQELRAELAAAKKAAAFRAT